MMDSHRSIISSVFGKKHKFLEELTREWLTDLVILNVCFVCLFVRVLHANVMQSIMSHFSASPPSTNGPLLTDTYEFGNVISFSHNFAATFYQFHKSYSITTKIVTSPLKIRQSKINSHWVAGPIGQPNRRPSVWCSKYYFFRLFIDFGHSKLFTFIFVFF